MQVFKPLYLSLRFLFSSQRMEARRVRGFMTLGLLVVLITGLLVLPAPLITRAEGVVWLDDKARVLSGADGFVVEVVATSGTSVETGDLLIRLEDKELDARRAVLQARLRELRTQEGAEREQSRVRGAMVVDDIEATNAELKQLDARLSSLEVRSAVAGQFYAHDPHESRGRYVRQGDVLGYVLQEERPIVRAVVNQDHVGLLRSRPVSAEVILSDDLTKPLAATLLREVPAGSTELPSAALGAMGGGDIAVDTRDGTGLTAVSKLFQFDLALPEGTRTTGIGGRAYVRLEHGTEPLWRQWSRSLQQLLLSQLKV
jgi:putative peptide zinc metalloprotease protein